MGYASIPTIYNGIRFRSRLEARWAGFFDQLGWQWVYEPIDAAGWIPDFMLCKPESAAPSEVLVEVKPAFDFPQDAADKIDAAYPEDIHFHEHPILIVGAAPIQLRHGQQLGWMRHCGWSRALFCQNRSGEIGFALDAWPSLLMIWPSDLMTGKLQDVFWGPYASNLVSEAWARASNLSQWHPD